jgi:hypothetical protein
MLSKKTETAELKSIAQCIEGFRRLKGANKRHRDELATNEMVRRLIRLLGQADGGGSF